jgi:hypothetical protein
MSCYTTTDANGTVTRHYTGDVTMTMTSASTGGAGYTPPACYQQHSVVSAPEPGALALLVLGLIALRMNLALRRGIRSE